MSSSRTWRRPLGLCAILTFAIHALRAFLLCPLNVQVNTNILYITTIWPAILGVAVDVALMAVIYIAYTFILETLFREGLARALPVAGIYLAAAVFGAGANLVMDLTVGGADETIVGLLIFSSISGILQELAQLILVMAIAACLGRGYRGRLIPTGLFSAENRLQLAALLAAAVTVCFRVGARLIYDIDLGLPTTALQVIDMVAGYGSDLLIPFLGYLGMVLLMMRTVEPTE